jgi:outer membrane protein, heavy metal efflux system
LLSVIERAAIMKRRYSITVGTVLTLATLSPLLAQSPLFLEDAIREAQAANPEVSALRRESEAVRALSAQEQHLAPPMLETQIWAWPVTTINPARTDMYMFMGEQELPGRGKRQLRAAVADRQADVAVQTVAIRANEIVNEVKQAYIDLALARETTAIYDRQVPLLREMADAATLRYAAGGNAGQQHHTVSALVDLTRVEIERVGSDERARAAEVRLNAVLGRPQDQPIGPLAPFMLDVSPLEVELVAVKSHPRIVMADVEIAKEEAELARLRNERRPDFVVGGGYMLMPGDAGAWTARAGLTWPNAPWARGRLDAAIDAQTKRLAAATARREAAVAGVRRSVREAAVKLAAAERRAQLIEKTVLPHLEHVFELSHTAYTAGTGDFAEVLESRRLLVAAEIDRASARADVYRARSEVAVAGGVQ